MRHLNNGTDHRHSKSCCDQRSPARRTITQANGCTWSLEVLSLIPTGSTIIYWFLCGFIWVSMFQSNKIKPANMYIARARAQVKIDMHKCWNWHLYISDMFSVVQCHLGHVVGIVVFDTISVAWNKRRTGSCWCCLSLEVVRLIAAGSMMIHHFLCGFIWVSLCQSINIEYIYIYIVLKKWQYNCIISLNQMSFCTLPRNALIFHLVSISEICKAPVTQNSTSKSRTRSYENLVDVVVSGNFW